MNVHLVDGTYELFRAFYGAPEGKSPEGKEVGATRSLLRSLWRLVNETGVTHVACAFDHVIESFRNQMFSGYKTGEGIDPDLFAQFPLAEQASRALGIVTWPMVEFEADDALATAAVRFAEKPEVDQVVICSPDKDLAQCVCGRKIVLWDRLRNRVYDEAGVREKFGVAPESIPDYLALVGDAADGIPGVPRWGAKSAALVLGRYQRLENIPERPDSWEIQLRGRAALSATLRAHWGEVLLFRRLARLRVDVPLAESLDQLKLGGPDRQLLEALCDKIGDFGFLDRAVGPR